VSSVVIKIKSLFLNTRPLKCMGEWRWNSTLRGGESSSCYGLRTSPPDSGCGSGEKSRCTSRTRRGFLLWSLSWGRL